MSNEGKSSTQQAALYLTYGVVGGMMLGILIGSFVDRVGFGIGMGMAVGCFVSALFIGRLDSAKKRDAADES